MPHFCPAGDTPGPVGGWQATVLKSLLLSSYLVMPFMQTDLQKIMGMEFSEEKVQYLVYQMLKGLKVSVACTVARGCSALRPSTLWWEGRGSDAGMQAGASDSPCPLPLPFSTSTQLVSSTG